MPELTYSTGYDVVVDEMRYYWVLIDEADRIVVARSDRYFDTSKQAAHEARSFGFKRTAHTGSIDTVTSRALQTRR